MHASVGVHALTRTKCVGATPREFLVDALCRSMFHTTSEHLPAGYGSTLVRAFHMGHFPLVRSC